MTGQRSGGLWRPLCAITAAATLTTLTLSPYLAGVTLTMWALTALIVVAVRTA